MNRMIGEQEKRLNVIEEIIEVGLYEMDKEEKQILKNNIRLSLANKDLTQSGLRKHYDAFLKIYDRIKSEEDEDKIKELKVEFLRLYILAEYDSKRSGTVLSKCPEMVKVIREFIEYICDVNTLDEMERRAKEVRRVYEAIVALAKGKEKRR